MSTLPQGFVLDEEEQGLPEGFVVDEAPQKEDGFMEAMKRDFAKRKQQLSTSREETAAGRQTGLEREIQELGTIAGGAGDVMGNVIGAAASGLGGLIPEEYKRPVIEKAQEIAASPVGQSVIGTIGAGMEKYGQFAQESPRAARNIESIANIGLLGFPAASRAEKIAEPIERASVGVVSKLIPKERMTSEQLRKVGGDLFKQADKMGGSFTQHLMGKLYQDIDTVIDLPKTPNQIAIAKSNLSPTVSAKVKIKDTIDNLQATGQPLSLRDVQDLDEALGDAAFSSVDNFGRMDKAASKYLDAQHTLRQTIENAGAQDLVNKGAFDTVKEARKYWASSLKLRDIERIIDRSENMDVPSTSVKNGFNALKNSKLFRTYTKAEQEAISEAAKTGIATGILKTMGNRLGAIGAGVSAGAVTMNPLVGAGVGLATYGAGAAARAGATALQMKKARFVADLIRERVSKSKGTEIKLTPEISKLLGEVGITTLPAGGVSEVLDLLEQIKKEQPQGLE